MNIDRHSIKWLTAIVVITGTLIGLTSCGGGGYGGGGDSGSSYAMPTVSFSNPASAMTINLGQSVKLAWNSTYASSCTASTSSNYGGTFSGAQNISGTQSVAPTAVGMVTYMLSCTGSGGSASATSATVTNMTMVRISGSIRPDC